MRRPKFTTDVPASSIEAEIAGLSSTRANLHARQEAMAAEVERAVAARRTLLIDGRDPAAVAEAERTARELESTAFGIADAVAEIDRRLADAQIRLTADRERTEREAVADDLERGAVEIEKAASSLARAVQATAEAHAVLALAIGGHAAGRFDPLSPMARPAEIARSLLLQGLAAALPDLDVFAEVKPWSPYSFRQLVEGGNIGEIVAGFGERLRDTAGQVRRGEIHHRLPDPQDLPRLVTDEELAAA